MSDEPVTENLSPRARARAAGKAHLTIKLFSIATRQLALKHAKLQGLSMASWIDRAVHTQARLEGTSGPVVMPEPVTGVTVQAAPNVRGMSVIADMLVVAQAAQMIAEASGRPMSKRTAGRVYQVLDHCTRTAVAVLEPPEPRRQPPVRKAERTQPTMPAAETKRVA